MCKEEIENVRSLLNKMLASQECNQEEILKVSMLLDSLILEHLKENNMEIMAVENNKGYFDTEKITKTENKKLL